MQRFVPFFLNVLQNTSANIFGKYLLRLEKECLEASGAGRVGGYPCAHGSDAYVAEVFKALPSRGSALGLSTMANAAVVNKLSVICRKGGRGRFRCEVRVNWAL